MMPLSYVHPFGAGVGDPAQLGSKGAGLTRMFALGLPIPPGFTITTEAWRAQRGNSIGIPAAIGAEIDRSLRELERQLDRAFDDAERPLLVSVRSGAPVSMPGMMDTVLNLGLSDQVVRGLAAQAGERFAGAIYLRLLETYAEIVRQVPARALAEARERACSAEDWEAQTAVFKQLIAEHGGPFPQSARDQLDEAIVAVWRSWDGPRARRYRRFRGLPEDLGTAVTVQAMVFGNLDDRSGTGVVFTRDPATGAPGAYGDFMRCAQGEDVVAGLATPESIEVLAIQMPDAFAELDRALTALEAEFRDMCDIEFTVERGRLWILQARVGQRSGAAAVRIAVDMVQEGLIDIETAIERVPLSALEELQAPVVDPAQALPVLGHGVAASPGAAIGRAVFDSQAAEDAADRGEDTVLIRPETSPKDISGMIAARGIVTAIGGRASHAAVVARGIGRPAVCGVGGLTVSGEQCTFANGATIRRGELLTVDGSRGAVLLGAAKLIEPTPEPCLERFLSWCARRARVQIVAAPPAGFEPVSSVQECEQLGAEVLVDLPWERSESRVALERLCVALRKRGVERRLAFALPESLRGSDLTLPDARWEAIVAPPRLAWAAMLLSAKTSLADRRGAAQPAEAAVTGR